MNTTVVVTYWGGEELEYHTLLVNSDYLTGYLTKELPYFTGFLEDKLVALNTNQIIKIEEE